MDSTRHDPSELPAGSELPPEAAASSERREEVLPLAFPRSRWLSFDADERARFNRAQLLLDATRVSPTRTVRALATDTGLGRNELGEGLALLEDLGLVDVDDGDESELSVSLVATPEEHIGVRFPDGQVHWVFVSRPVVEPDVPLDQLN